MTTTFVSRETRLVRANLDTFIAKYRGMGAFGLGKQPFEDDAWSYTGIASKGTSGYLYFTKLGFNRHKYRTNLGEPSLIPEAERMPPVYIQFAKAMLSHLHLTQATANVKSRRAALTWLLTALEAQDQPIEPTEVNVAVLEAACEMLRLSSLKQSSQALIAGALARIWKTMVDLELVRAPAHWKSPILSVGTKHNLKLGAPFDAMRHKKLPSPRTIEVLASLFQRDDTDLRTTFITSYVALALCAPERSVEFLFAPADLLTPWTDHDTQENGVSLRWYPAKGAHPQCKNVSLNMSPIARRAHARLYAISQPARELARWYEANPTTIYLPTNLEYLRGKGTIDINEAHAILYGGNVRKLVLKSNEHLAARGFLKTNNVPYSKGVGGRGGGRSGTLAFADLEQAVLRQLPEGFPIMDPTTGMKYSEALCILRRREFAGWNIGYMPAILQVVSYRQLANTLGGGQNTKSIFEQYGFTGDQGEPLRLMTHMLRHYLNTLVRRNGELTEEEIALWSGRKDVNQNATYDHESANDKLHELEVRLGFHSDTKPFGDLSKRIFIKRNQFGDIEKITAHLTDIGYCLHNYMQSPCPIMRNCIQCAESVCIKGDECSRRALDQLYADSSLLTAAARRDMEDEMDGATEWFNAHLEREGVLKNLLNILDNPDIQDGTPIILNVETPNRLKEAIARRTIPIRSVAASIQSMSDVTRLLAAPANSVKGMSDAA